MSETQPDPPQPDTQDDDPAQWAVPCPHCGEPVDPSLDECDACGESVIPDEDDE